MSRVIQLVVLCGLLAGISAEGLAQTRRRAIRQTSATLLEPEFDSLLSDEEPPFESDQPSSSSRRAALFRELDSDLSDSALTPEYEPRFETADEAWEPLRESPTDLYFDYNAEAFEWQVLPPGLMYQSYLAGPKEPRFNAVWLRDRNGKLNWETQLGGRVGIVRNGTRGVIFPQGWQLDLEGACQTRVLPENNSDLESVDYRFGLLSTWRNGPWSMKAGYYHISSHLGDEFLIANTGYPRLNYVRDSAIAGVSYDLLIWDRPDVRIYGEVGYAFGAEDGAEPLEFQFGSEYSPFVFNGFKGAPFVAMNTHLREDHDWSRGFNIVAGWQWRGEETNHRFRIGLQYYDGPSLQFSFSGQDETVFGWGLWFDY